MWSRARAEDDAAPLEEPEVEDVEINLVEVAKIFKTNTRRRSSENESLRARNLAEPKIRAFKSIQTGPIQTHAARCHGDKLRQVRLYRCGLYRFKCP